MSHEWFPQILKGFRNTWGNFRSVDMKNIHRTLDAIEISLFDSTEIILFEILFVEASPISATTSLFKRSSALFPLQKYSPNLSWLFSNNLPNAAGYLWAGYLYIWCLKSWYNCHLLVFFTSLSLTQETAPLLCL